MKFTKKPVTIEAIELKNDYSSIVECVEFVFKIGMESSYIAESATVDKVKAEGGFIIPTMEGDMKASFGDWIIKGIKGEFYPCKPDIFAASYSPASDPTPSSAEVYRKALEELVELKRIKDTEGKTEDYERRQPLAWKKAAEVLSHSSQPEQVKGEDWEEVPVFSLKQVAGIVLEFGNMVSAAKGKGFDMPNDSAEFVHGKYKYMKDHPGLDHMGAEQI